MWLAVLWLSILVQSFDGGCWRLWFLVFGLVLVVVVVDLVVLVLLLLVLLLLLLGVAVVLWLSCLG